MDAILVALITAVGLVVPSVLSLRFGKKRQLALIRDEAQRLADIPEHMDEARKNMERALDRSVWRYDHISAVGSIPALTFGAAGGFTLLAIGRTMKGADSDHIFSESDLITLTQNLGTMLLYVGVLVLLYGAVSLYSGLSISFRTLRGMTREHKKLKAELATLTAERKMLEERLKTQTKPDESA
jgi:hypothetical protein